MASTKRKFDFLKLKEKWRAKSSNNKKIVAMAAKITALKGQLKLDPKLSTIADEGKNKGNNGKKMGKDNTSNKREKKKDEA